MRTLVLDLGNSTLFCGVFAGQRLTLSFRVPTREVRTWAEFERRVARRVRGKIDRAAFCSVVPALTQGLSRQVQRAFGIPAHPLTADAPHGLIIGYREPRRLGADRLACAVGAHHRYPGRNVIVVDCGTATTLTALRRDGRLLGGMIMPGLALWPQMLSAGTAQLPRVSPRRTRTAIGRSPEEAIAIGIWIGHVGAIREGVQRLRKEAFGRSDVLVVGTGGQAPALFPEKIFNLLDPKLILHGLRAYCSVLE